MTTMHNGHHSLAQTDITVYPIGVSMCIYVIWNYGVGSDQLRRIELDNAK